MKKKLPVIIISAVILFFISIIAIDGIKKRMEINIRTDTDKNALLLAQSGLADFEVNEDDEIYSAIHAPWIIIEKQEEETGEYVWHILASSIKKIDENSLSSVKTVVIAKRRAKSGSYRSNYGASTTGTTEDVELTYYDTATGCYIATQTVYGKSLPKKAGSTPHFKVSNKTLAKKVAEQVRSKVNPKFNDSGLYVDDGRFRAKAAAYNPATLGIPDSVHTILPNALNENEAGYVPPASVYIPPTVTEIGENAFTEDCILIVEHDSFAEEYAQQNGFCYRYPGSQELFGNTGE